MPNVPKFETPRLTAFELPDCRALAQQWVEAHLTLKPEQVEVMVGLLSTLLIDERLRLADSFAKLVRKVNHTARPAFATCGNCGADNTTDGAKHCFRCGRLL